MLFLILQQPSPIHLVLIIQLQNSDTNTFLKSSEGHLQGHLYTPHITPKQNGVTSSVIKLRSDWQELQAVVSPV